MCLAIGLHAAGTGRRGHVTPRFPADVRHLVEGHVPTGSGAVTEPALEVVGGAEEIGARAEIVEQMATATVGLRVPQHNAGQRRRYASGEGHCQRSGAGRALRKGFGVDGQRRRDADRVERAPGVDLTTVMADPVRGRPAAKAVHGQEVAVPGELDATTCPEMLCCLVDDGDVAVDEFAQHGSVSPPESVEPGDGDAPNRLRHGLAELPDVEEVEGRLSH